MLRPDVLDWFPRANVPGGAVPISPVTPTRVVVYEEFIIEAFGMDFPQHKGDTGDLMSYPWLPIPLYSPFSGAAASVAHDKWYEEGDILPRVMAETTCPQTVEALDRVMHEWPQDEVPRLLSDVGWYLIAVEGHSPETRMSQWKACAGYRGLRIGGWAPWNRYRKNDANR